MYTHEYKATQIRFIITFGLMVIALRCFQMMMTKPKPIYWKLHCIPVECQCCYAVHAMSVPVLGGWLGSTSPLILLLLDSSSPDSSDSPLRSTVVDRQRRRKRFSFHSQMQTNHWLAVPAFLQHWHTHTHIHNIRTTPSSTSPWSETMWCEGVNVSVDGIFKQPGAVVVLKL